MRVSVTSSILYESQHCKVFCWSSPHISVEEVIDPICVLLPLEAAGVHTLELTEPRWYWWHLPAVVTSAECGNWDVLTQTCSSVMTDALMSGQTSKRCSDIRPDTQKWCPHVRPDTQVRLWCLWSMPPSWYSRCCSPTMSRTPPPRSAAPVSGCSSQTWRRSSGMRSGRSLLSPRFSFQGNRKLYQT